MIRNNEELFINLHIIFLITIYLIIVSIIYISSINLSYHRFIYLPIYHISSICLSYAYLGTDLIVDVQFRTMKKGVPPGMLFRCITSTVISYILIMPICAYYNYFQACYSSSTYDLTRLQHKSNIRKYSTLSIYILMIITMMMMMIYFNWTVVIY